MGIETVILHPFARLGDKPVLRLAHPANRIRRIRCDFDKAEAHNTTQMLAGVTPRRSLARGVSSRARRKCVVRCRSTWVRIAKNHQTRRLEASDPANARRTRSRACALSTASRVEWPHR